jgi:YgiT-type zinc finger domain-containing protein
MICKHGKTKQGTTTVTLEKGSSTIVFKEVPAQICDNCGEKYIDESTTKELLSKARNIVKNGVEIDIRKYDIAA